MTTTNPSPTTEAAVHARGLVKTFGDLRAVDGIDLDVHRGEVFGVLGPNGAGKTTMLKMLATLLPIDGGEAELFGVDVRQHPHVVRQLLGVTGQYASVDENLTGRENLWLFGRLLGLSSKQARSTAEDLLDRFGLEDAGDKPISKFSGGMRRRLDLAASLISRPPLIFLDEPTTGLDPRTRGQMWDTIRELVADGCTVLLTTQYLDEADQLADRIAVIDRGRKVAEGTPDELKSQVGSSTLQLRMLDPDAHRRGRRRRAPGARRGAGAHPRGGRHQRRPHRRQPRRRRADRPARARPADQLGDRAEAHPRRGVPGPDRPRRRGPTSPSPRWSPSDDHHPQPRTRRDRHRGHRRRHPRPAGAPHRPRDLVAEPGHGLARDEEDAPQPRAVVRRDHPAAALHRDVRLHLRRRDLRQRRRLPADPHPRHPRPDRAHRLHGHRHPAARGHGQGRLRPLQVAADRPDRPARRPGDRRPAALRHRRDAHHLHRRS